MYNVLGPEIGSLKPFLGYLDIPLFSGIIQDGWLISIAMDLMLV